MGAHLVVVERYVHGAVQTALHRPVGADGVADVLRVGGQTQYPAAYNSIAAQKMLVWLILWHR